MKAPSKIVISSTALAGNQSITQTTLDNTILPTTARLTHKAATKAVPGSLQSHRHIYFQVVDEDNGNKNQQLSRHIEILQDCDKIKRQRKKRSQQFTSLNRIYLRRGRSWSWIRVWNVILLKITPTKPIKCGTVRTHWRQLPTRIQQWPPSIHQDFI